MTMEIYAELICLADNILSTLPPHKNKGLTISTTVPNPKHTLQPFRIFIRFDPVTLSVPVDLKGLVEEPLKKRLRSLIARFAFGPDISFWKETDEFYHLIYRMRSYE